MARRRRISRRHSKRMFKKTAGFHRLNGRLSVMRGGFRV